MRNRHFLPRDATHETDAVSGHSIRARTGRTRTQRKGRVRNARACLRVCYHVPVGGHSLPAPFSPPRDNSPSSEHEPRTHTHTERTVRSCVCVPRRAAIRRRVSQAERVGATNARSNGLFTVPGVCHREREREREAAGWVECVFIYPWPRSTHAAVQLRPVSRPNGSGKQTLPTTLTCVLTRV